MGKGGCIACHKAGAIGASPLGPDLSQIARIQTPEYIMAKILDPAGMGTVAGYPPNLMPPTFGQVLTAKEYVDLVSFLLTLKGEEAASATAAKNP
jgi:mono/diheme cytochrome c family protein